MSTFDFLSGDKIHLTMDARASSPLKKQWGPDASARARFTASSIAIGLSTKYEDNEVNTNHGFPK